MADQKTSFKCSSCGAQLIFQEERLRFRCDYCGCVPAQTPEMTDFVKQVAYARSAEREKQAPRVTPAPAQPKPQPTPQPRRTTYAPPDSVGQILSAFFFWIVAAIGLFLFLAVALTYAGQSEQDIIADIEFVIGMPLLMLNVLLMRPTVACRARKSSAAVCAWVPAAVLLYLLLKGKVLAGSLYVAAGFDLVVYLVKKRRWDRLNT